MQAGMSAVELAGVIRQARDTAAAEHAIETELHANRSVVRMATGEVNSTLAPLASEGHSVSVESFRVHYPHVMSDPRIASTMESLAQTLESQRPMRASFATNAEFQAALSEYEHNVNQFMHDYFAPLEGCR